MPTRPNYIEMYAWGRKPRSKRRRRAALFAWLGPTVLFLFVLFVGGIVAFSIDQANNLNTASFRPFGSHAFMAAGVGMFIASWLAGLVFCFLLPIAIAVKTWNGAIRRIDTPPTDDDLAFLPPSPAKSAAVAADPADTRD